jgi:hypothetical protein
MRPWKPSLLIVLALVSCSALATAADSPVRIEWSKDTLTLIEQGAGYGRMVRVKGGDILCCFDKGGQIWVKASLDGGKSWGNAPVLVAKSDFGGVTNPELLELHDGSLFCCFNERPNDGVHPYAILICSSSDGGRKWSVPQRIYKADTKFENGCWEPATIQLSDGELQLFFANESPYQTSNEQEITMLRSLDHGRTWQKPITVSFRRGCRDGMPVPLVLQDGPKGIAVVIEDNGLCGNFKPVIVYSSLQNNWGDGPIVGNSQYRWPALSLPLEPNIYAGGPYLRQLPAGETVLSFQCTEAGRTQPHMVVCVGNNWCRGFASWSIPFEVESGTACLWNSLFVKSNDVITAVSGTMIKGIQGLRAVDGKVIRNSAHGSASARRATDIMSIWEHRIDGGPAQFHAFYSNGNINNPRGPARWTLKGDTLTMRWPTKGVKKGAWVDRCVLSSDGKSYSGTNQHGNRITGRLSQARFSPVDESRE